MTVQRAVTILGEQGDVTIVWTEDEDDKMEAIIAAKMAQGIAFFIIEPRFFGLLPSRKTELADAADARKYRALAIKDAQFGDFVGAGHGDVVKSPEAPAKTVKRAASAKEAAKAESVGVQPLRGG